MNVLEVVGWALLAIACGVVALPAVVDLIAAVVALRTGTVRKESGSSNHERIVFLVPAHNEELLIQRCVESLLGMRYPADRFRVLVVADNCTDSTASVAAACGAMVLERSSETARGKSFAIGWALGQLSLDEWDAIVTVLALASGVS